MPKVSVYLSRRPSDWRKHWLSTQESESRRSTILRKETMTRRLTSVLWMNPSVRRRQQITRWSTSWAKLTTCKRLSKESSSTTSWRRCECSLSLVSSSFPYLWFSSLLSSANLLCQLAISSSASHSSCPSLTSSTRTFSNKKAWNGDIPKSFAAHYSYSASWISLSRYSSRFRLMTALTAPMSKNYSASIRYSSRTQRSKASLIWS